MPPPLATPPVNVTVRRPYARRAGRSRLAKTAEVLLARAEDQPRPAHVAARSEEPAHLGTPSSTMSTETMASGRRYRPPTNGHRERSDTVSMNDSADPRASPTDG